VEEDHPDGASGRGAWRRGLARALVASGAVVLGLVLFLSNGALDELALAGVTFATAASLVAMLLGRGAPGEEGSTAWRWVTLGVLAAGIAASFAIDASYLPGVYVDPAGLSWFRPVLGAFGALVATHAVKVPPRVAKVRFGLELAAAAALGGSVIRASPVPLIDVWYFEQMGATALLRGANPYAIAYPNIYGPLSGFISGALLSPDRTLVLAFPYTPLTLLLVAPATALASEPRWTMLAATLFSAWAVRRLGRGSAEASLAAVFLLVQPRGLFVIEQAWTEPLVLASVLAVALLVVRRAEDAAASGPDRSLLPRSWLPVALAGAVALAVKQYAPLVLLPLLFLAPRPARLRTAAVAVAGALAVALPFVFWDAPAFFRGVIQFQLVQPFRADALSWPAALVRYAGLQRPPTWPAFMLAGAVLLLACRPPVSIARALTGSAAAWLVFVLLNKQAFCNYYWLAAGLLCAAVGAGARGAAPAVACRAER
jgi:hypothetical protein